MNRRLTEDFVHHFLLLKEKLRDNPNNVRAVLARNNKLALTIRALSEIWNTLERHRRFSKRGFIVQADPKFYELFSEYSKRWHALAESALTEWEVREAGEDEAPEGWIFLQDDGDAEEPLGAASKLSSAYRREWYDHEFDPDEHSAEDAVKLAETVLEQETWVDPHGPHAAACDRALGALKWLRETVDLDIGIIQSRWKDIPVIVVPAPVSDSHGIEDDYSLFGYLTQIRRAYIIGADLAAIAMCRAVTEILIRRHYNPDAKPDAKLMALIISTQKMGHGRALKKYNIAQKVRWANDVLHDIREDIRHRDRSRAVVSGWIPALQAMINDLANCRHK